ncbi:hypothetical protein PsorP6_000270 [Peronosclerospora sorghi]|uniref:Uncharacterized protein n=1 Tax=Peronosclerospora sorghi TaxID=230839 RepID=A0ACC0WQH8_9STRA|nr:hypothetical protein PsorP6_000270 [Peronosclerospora sorghi]
MLCETACMWHALQCTKLSTPCKYHSNECFHCCEMKGCNERCSTTNHFHDDPVIEVEMVVTLGTCSSRAMRATKCARQSEFSSSCFAGCYGDFDYDLKRMVGARNKCWIQLEPGERKHLGLQSCGVRLVRLNARRVPIIVIKCMDTKGSTRLPMET